jgi:hypothetical protein
VRHKTQFKVHVAVGEDGVLVCELQPTLGTNAFAAQISQLCVEETGKQLAGSCLGLARAVRKLLFMA